jgi:HK97 family phage major capsid protein
MNQTRGYRPPHKPQIIGYRKSGAPIWQQLGGQPDELELLASRQRELIDLMEAVNKDIDAEGRSAEQRKSDTATFEGYDKEYAENEKRIGELNSLVEERKAREQRVKERRAHYGSVDVKPGRKSDNDFYNSIDYRYIGVESDGMSERGSHHTWVQRAEELLNKPEIAGHLHERKAGRTGERRDNRVEPLLHLLRQSNGDTDGELIAAFLVATSNPYYRSAFQKASSGIAPIFSPEEARAVREVNQLKRAMSVGTSGAGGYAVPVIIDPTIILTAQGSDNPILDLARVETITNDKWKGLSSAGVTWKFGAEASAATDNSPTIAQPEVDTHRADGFIPFSIEIGMDWPGFAERMSDMLGSGYSELLADKLTNGTGADTPIGIISRLVAQTSPDVSTELATAGVIAPGDIYDLWARLPQRHRGRQSTAFMSSTKTQNSVRQLGTLDPNFTVDMTEEGITRLFGRRYPMNDYFDDHASGTGTQELVVAGNWQGFLVAQRAGMNIEFVPMLFDVTNNRPTGQRGWFAWARVGSDVVDPTAFQLLTNRSA